MKGKYLIVTALLMATVWFGLVGLGSAATTTWGPTGLINVPTADVNVPGRLDLAMHHLKSRTSLVASYGVLDTLEAGIGVHNLGGDSELSINVKGVLIEETADLPALALGLSGVEDTTYYMVASKSLPGLGIRGHLGIGSGRVDGLFIGAEKVLNPVTVTTSGQGMRIPVTTLMAEWDGSDLNIGADFAFSYGLKVRVMINDMDSLGVGLQLSAQL